MIDSRFKRLQPSPLLKEDYVMLWMYKNEFSKHITAASEKQSYVNQRKNQKLRILNMVSKPLQPGFSVTELYIPLLNQWLCLPEIGYSVLF